MTLHVKRGARTLYVCTSFVGHIGALTGMRLPSPVASRAVTLAQGEGRQVEAVAKAGWEASLLRWTLYPIQLHATMGCVDSLSSMGWLSVWA